MTWNRRAKYRARWHAVLLKWLDHLIPSLNQGCNNEWILDMIESMKPMRDVNHTHAFTVSCVTDNIILVLRTQQLLPRHTRLQFSKATTGHCCRSGSMLVVYCHQGETGLSDLKLTTYLKNCFCNTVQMSVQAQVYLDSGLRVRPHHSFVCK